jgi:hypothetical protein
MHYRTDIGATHESAASDNENYAKELETDVLIVGAGFGGRLRHWGNLALELLSRRTCRLTDTCLRILIARDLEGKLENSRSVRAKMITIIAGLDMVLSIPWNRRTAIVLQPC